MTHQSHIETIPPRDALIREKQNAVIARIAATGYDTSRLLPGGAPA